MDLSEVKYNRKFNVTDVTYTSSATFHKSFNLMNNLISNIIIVYGIVFSTTIVHSELDNYLFLSQNITEGFVCEVHRLY